MKRYLLIAALWIVTLPVAGQSKEELQQLIRQAEQEIEATNALIDRTRQDKSASENELKLVRNQISNRRTIIDNLGKQIGTINQDIGSKTRRITDLNSQLASLKRDYAEMVYSAYKSYKLNNFILFIFSSEDFNEATRRIDFIRRYNRLREEKVAQINAVTDSILLEVSMLDQTRAELDNTMESRNTELASLAQDETTYRNTVSRLRTQESRLSQQVQERQNDIDKAQRRIQELIAEEARRNSQARNSDAEIRHIVELSGRFEQNKGRLPYPVSGGVVIDKFGEHAHSVVKTSRIVNRGVNIAATGGAEVRAVFDGTVTAIFNASILNNCIIVRHGDYVTVYANVVTVAVKTGDKVSLNQRLGRLSDSEDSDTHFLHFEVLENGIHVNPELWIKR